MSMTKLLGVSDVCDALNITEGELWKLITDKRFPPPLQLGLRRKVWIAIDLVKFQERVESMRGEQLISGRPASETDAKENVVSTVEG